jgi:hypothetical protein
VKRQAGDGGERKNKRKSTYTRGEEIVAGGFPVAIEIETEVYRVLREEWGGTGETDKR